MRSSFTKLSDSQWQVIQSCLPKQKPKKLCLRDAVNAILFITVTGVHRRNLPSEYPKRQGVYYYFRQWQQKGVFTLIMNTLRETARQKSDKQPAPSLAVIGSPTVKTASFAARDKGIDGNKKVNGRKRHIAVDTNGYPMAVYVGAAHRHDSQAGLELLALSDKQGLERLTAIRADSAYQGVFVNRQHILLGNTTQASASSDKGFVPQKNRRQEERTFARLNFFRGLSKDYEKTTESATAFIIMALSSVMLAKIN